MKDRPLRLPGQSLKEERDAIWEDKLEPVALLALVFVAFAAVEWWRVWTHMQPSPILFTIVAAFFVVLTAGRILRVWPRLRALNQGIDGERVVGEYLERLRSRGYRVFHDVIGPAFNVDHVVIGPAGVFTIETKTRSKPAHGDARVTGDSDGLLIAGFRPDRDPIAQARAQAKWVQQQINESTGKSFTAKPVIVFPGWFIDPSAQRLPDLWVLEPKAVPAFLDHERERLSPDDIALAAFHLSRMIRSGERK